MMWALLVLLAVFLGAISMLAGVYVGFGLAERGWAQNKRSEY